MHTVWAVAVEYSVSYTGWIQQSGQSLYNVIHVCIVNIDGGIRLEKIYFGVETKAEVLGAAFVCFIFRKWVYACEHLRTPKKHGQLKTLGSNCVSCAIFLLRFSSAFTSAWVSVRVFVRACMCVCSWWTTTSFFSFRTWYFQCLDGECGP